MRAFSARIFFAKHVGYVAALTWGNEALLFYFAMIFLLRSASLKMRLCNR